MNEIGSLFLATAVLAVGGLGLYIYKSDSDEDMTDKNETIDEDYLEETYEDPEIIETKTKSIKTKRNRRKSVGTKRRY